VAERTSDSLSLGTARSPYETCSFLSCPVISRNTVLGILTVNDKSDGNPFSEDDLTLVKLISDQVGVFLANSLLEAQLRSMSSEFEGMNRLLIDSDRKKAEFLARVSHELRTPLNSIKGSTYHLQTSSDMVSQDSAEFLHIIAQEAEKLSNIVENQIELLKIDDESPPLNNVIILREIMVEVVKSRLVTEALARRNIRLVVEPGVENGEVIGNRSRVIQLLVNLIEGLGTFLSSGDIMVLSTEDVGVVDLSLTLSRSLPEMTISNLFASRNLFKLENQPDMLKLYLSRKIAENHGWRFTAGNSAGSFVVTITIPRNVQQKADTLLSKCLTMYANLTAELMGLDVCSVMLAEEHSGDLIIKGARGVDPEVIKKTRIRNGDRISGWVAMQGKALLVPDIVKDQQFSPSNRDRYGSDSLISLPLRKGNRVIGVLNLTCKKTEEPFTERDLAVATILGDRISSVVTGFTSGAISEKELGLLMTSLEILLSTTRNSPKKGEQMGALVESVMNKMGRDAEEKNMALFTTLVYDLGLAGTTESLGGKHPLQPPELRAIRSHPDISVALIDNIEPSYTVKQAILHHHENYDGSGYPDQLRGDEIPLLARVLAVVDSYCAMTSQRPFRGALSKDQALRELNQGMGGKYDPHIVRVMEEVVREAA
jgi:hypothetical protein